jgi:hypothetical protein
VAAISVLSIIGGLVAAVFGLIAAAMSSSGIALGGIIGRLASYLSLMGILLFLGGLFSLFVGWGLWKGVEWAWTLAVILEILGIIGGIFTIPYGLIGVLVYGLILYYLLKPNVKVWFKTKKKKEENETVRCPHCNLNIGIPSEKPEFSCPWCEKSISMDVRELTKQVQLQGVFDN